MYVVLKLQDNARKLPKKRKQKSTDNGGKLL